MLMELTMAAAVAGGPGSEVERRIADRLASFQGVMGVAAVHLGTGETIAVAADTRFPTASGIKTAVMVEVFQQVAAGKLTLERTVTLPEGVKVGGSGVLKELHAGSVLSVADLLFLMIAISGNTATNLLVGLVGTPAVNERMAPDASRQMEALLGKQQVHELLCRLLPSAGDDVTVAHKTGRDEEKLPDAEGAPGSVRMDAGIVTTPKGRYVIAIFARRVKDMRWTVDNDALVTGAWVSRAVYDHFTRTPPTDPTRR